MRRHAVVLAVSLVLSIANGQAAYAGGTADGWTDGNGIGSETSTNTGTNTPGGHGGGSSGITCKRATFDPEQIKWLNENLDPSILNFGNGPTDSYDLICNDATGNIVSVTNGAPPAGPSVVDMARQAFDYRTLPLPGIVLNPPTDRVQIVNLDTWLSVSSSDWRVVTAQVSQAGITVTTTATPKTVTWSTGDGAQVVCPGPGATYNASLPSNSQHTDCSHAYKRTSAGLPDSRYVVTATVDWHVTWAAVGVAPGTPANGDLGNVQRASNTTLRVGEIQAINRKN